MSNPIINYNTFWANVAILGGGIYCDVNSDLMIRDNEMYFNSAVKGGGIYCENSEPLIKKNLICDGFGTNGGAIYCENADPLILNNTMIRNNGTSAGGIYLRNSCPNIINNTISRNHGTVGGGLFCENSIPFIVNTIFREDRNAGIQRFEIVVVGSLPRIIYCNIHDSLWPGEGNIDIDPLFRDPENGDFHLMATYCGDQYNSPCIDAGYPDMLDSLLDCDWGLRELRSDMGAYGGGEGYVDIEEIPSILPEKIFLFQNYSNPFNAQTIIQYNLPSASHVSIDIYNILGRRVETLIDKQQQAGCHQVVWNADDKTSGVYFYKLQAGDYIETKKMLL